MSKIVLKVIAVTITTLCLATLVGCHREQPKRLSIGWMLRWSDVGEVAVALQKAPELAHYQNDFEWHPFMFGPEVNEAALSGNVDVTLTGVVPAMYLMAKSDEWGIIGRAATFEVSTVVQKDSPFQHMADLKGRKIAIPVGGGSHPYFMGRIKELGLSLGSGPAQIELVNLNPVDQLEAFTRHEVDAAATWEPQTSVLQGRAGAIKIDSGKQVGFINAKRSADPTLLAEFQRAYADAIWYVKNNRAKTRQWLAEVSSTPIATLESLPTIDPNYMANVDSREKVDITLHADDLTIAEKISAQMFADGLIKREVEVRRRIFGTPLPRASAGTPL